MSIERLEKTMDIAHELIWAVIITGIILSMFGVIAGFIMFISGMVLEPLLIKYEHRSFVKLTNEIYNEQ